MDLIESFKQDKAYAKYKQIVKSWEKEFKFKFGRIPSKFDIKEAPSKIKYAYKKYFQLKSAALENSLSICDVEDELCGSPEYTQHLSITYDSPQKDQYTDNNQSLPSLPTGQELEKLLSNVSTTRCQNNKSSISIKPASPFTDNLSKKLFQNRIFSLRNPRKLSLSKSQSLIESESENNGLDNDKSKISNTDIKETTVFEKIPEAISTKSTICASTSHLGDFVHKCDNLSLRQVNTAWLDRASGLNNQHPSLSEEIPNKFGMSNIQVPISKEKTHDFVENSESEDDDINIKPALKKRKMSNNSILCLEKQSQQTNKLESKLTKNGKLLKKKYDLNKVENDEEKFPEIDEYLPFGLEEGISARLLKPTNILKTVSPLIKGNTLKSKDEELEKLERKISSGTLNDNFVKINIEKKVFVRGRKNINYSRYKKQQFKDKKALHAGMEFPESGKITCFKCGHAGHMARYCTAHRGDSLLPLDCYDEDEKLSLEDMQNIVSKETKNVSLPEQLNLSAFEPSPIPDSFKKLLLDKHEPDQKMNVKPIYSNIKQDVPSELHKALEKFGHKSFKSGQKEVIMRVLCGMSSLLILPTGGGKSLCYQLPAYIYSQHYKCITLVISPLVSLMEDQVLSMPEFLKAGCLHTNQSSSQRQKIIQCLKEGEINILLISPEALISGDGSSGLTGLFKSLPQIAFACIDEAHCVSQWSHNFRPSYLMICRVLREKLNVKCILGLTATASQTTIKSIIRHINIPDDINGVITNPALPDNLHLSVSFEKDKDRALVQYLTSKRINYFNSIIVYCIRRDECERVAAVLRSCLQETGKVNMEQINKKRKRMSYIAEAYHAGMSAAQRKKIQKNFMDGTLRIIVATVAFGMGINKSDIRCIVHYNTPSSFESYVQEVGRAGRDGNLAYCHVFMNNNNNDKNELLRHIHSNTTDRPIIRKLLQKVFISCQCTEHEKTSSSVTSTNDFRCKGHEVGIPIDRTVEELDLPSENIATLLCYVELHPKQYIKVLNNAYTVCKISSYGGSQKILEAAKNCPPLAMAYLLESKKDPDIMKQNVIEFNVIEVAAAIGWESGMAKYQLKNLEWLTESGKSKRSLLKVELNTLGFRIKAPGDLSASELDRILDDLHDSVLLQEKTMLYQLEESNKAFTKVCDCSNKPNQLANDVLIQKSNELKQIIENYFQRDYSLPDDITFDERPLDAERVISDVRALISSYKDCTFTGRSIARIFQGITSPNYPAIVWGRCKFWRSHIHEDFYGIIKIATQQIIQMK